MTFWWYFRSRLAETASYILGTVGVVGGTKMMSRSIPGGRFLITLALPATGLLQYAAFGQSEGLPSLALRAQQHVNAGASWMKLHRQANLYRTELNNTPPGTMYSMIAYLFVFLCCHLQIHCNHNICYGRSGCQFLLTLRNQEVHNQINKQSIDLAILSWIMFACKCATDRLWPNNHVVQCRQEVLLMTQQKFWNLRLLCWSEHLLYVCWGGWVVACQCVSACSIIPIVSKW